MKHLHPDELPEDAVLIDIRDELEAAGRPLEELSAGRDVVKVPLADLEDGATVNLPPGKPVVVVCGNGSRSDVAGAFLEAAGVRDVAALEGGVRAWRRHAEGERTVEFHVPGVANAAGAEALRHALERVDGVRQAGVSLDGTVVVRGTAGRTALERALVDAGYRAAHP